MPRAIQAWAGRSRSKQQGFLSYLLLVVSVLVVVGVYATRSYLDPKETYTVYSANLRAEVQAVFQANEDLYARAVERQGALSFSSLGASAASDMASTGVSRYRLRAEAIQGSSAAQRPTFAKGLTSTGKTVFALVLGPLKHDICQGTPTMAAQADETAFLQALTDGTGVVFPLETWGCLTVGTKPYAYWVLGS